ncbi:MAG: hypothetical protein JWP34_5168 [Massilia sp.]|nr:hypothetical protein [Massilia sp.]
MSIAECFFDVGLKHIISVYCRVFARLWKEYWITEE